MAPRARRRDKVRAQPARRTDFLPFQKDTAIMKRLLPVVEAATYVSLSASTLNRLRVHGGGPRYVKLAGRVLYDVCDLDQWVEDSKRASTSAA
jgi:predicted DNA-binding transcriptional regulator AlpA